MPDGTILVADDDEGVLRALRRYFETLGYRVDTASSYVRVRELIDTNTYALIVCDNSMPLGGESRPHRTCGLQLLAHAHLRGILARTPFVLHTADDSDETKRLVQEFGGTYRYKYDISDWRPYLDGAATS